MSTFANLPTGKERYAARKAARLCVDCEAGLQDFDDGVRCVECSERNRAKQAAYKAAHPDRIKAKNKAYRKRNRTAIAAEQKEWRLKRRVDGKCRDCKADALEDSDYCHGHREAHRATARAYWRRKHPPRHDAVAVTSEERNAA